MLRKPFVLVFFRLWVRALKNREAGKLRRWVVVRCPSGRFLIVSYQLSIVNCQLLIARKEEHAIVKVVFIGKVVYPLP